MLHLRSFFSQRPPAAPQTANDSDQRPPVVRAVNRRPVDPRRRPTWSVGPHATRALGPADRRAHPRPQGPNGAPAAERCAGAAVWATRFGQHRTRVSKVQLVRSQESGRKKPEYFWTRAEEQEGIPFRFYGCCMLLGFLLGFHSCLWHHTDVWSMVP